MPKVLNDPFHKVAIRVHAPESDQVDSPIQILRGEVVPRDRLKLQRASGTRPQDVMWSTSANFLLISRRFVGVLDECSATGWKACGVDVEDVAEEYFALAVTGRCGAHDRSLAKVTVVDRPAGRFPKLMGLGIHEESWDGSDVVMSTDRTGWVLLSDRVSAIVERAGISNLELSNCSDIGFPRGV